jgi:uncharacterized sporulation protein YeaH/YhbH (DUF444 family)
MQIIDRRLNPSSKSLENRQRFLRRARALVQRAVSSSSQNRTIPEILEGGEVKIPLEGIEEPRFQRGSGGIRDAILPGNKKFLEGDVLPRPSSDGGNGSQAGEGDGEDTFRFVLTREEFLDLFLDDLELPDLAKKSLGESEQMAIRRAGYSVSGSPSSIAVGRTMRLALSRRLALGRPRPQALEKLAEEIAACPEDERRAALVAELEALSRKMRRIPFLDPIDIRYRRFETEPKPIVQAVMFCLMDVSASMSEHMKDLAKRFYMLLYIFLTKRYKHVEVVFIRHTDKAEEVDEETFFRGQASGGTVVSSALEAMAGIIATRYRPENWNIYAAQASDGDNSHSDGMITGQILKGTILPVTQYFAYLEVGEADRGSSSTSSLWDVYEALCAKGEPLAMRKVSHRAEIYPVFRDLFQRREGKVWAAL